jgi:hypothetical protein
MPWLGVLGWRLDILSDLSITVQGETNPAHAPANAGTRSVAFFSGSYYRTNEPFVSIDNEASFGAMEYSIVFCSSCALAKSVRRIVKGGKWERPCHLRSM